jgi:tetratricopeptide (TPR) repeat protein
MVAAGDYRPRFQLDRPDIRSSRSPQTAESRAVKAARKAVELSEVPGKATPLEKLYIASVAARRDPNQKQPDDAYVAALRELVRQHPREIEARSYLALAIMRGFVLPEKKPRPGSMEAVEILRELMQEAPDHPGVHHYVIHGWEGSAFAKEAWPSSARYAELVPNIPHALHMPGHIYSQTGRWEDAARSFEAAAENERGYMKADVFYGNGHHGHNVHYLVSSYSFQGQTDKAIAAARELLEVAENPRQAATPDAPFSAYRQGWFAMMRALVQGERWDQILDGSTLPVLEFPRQKAWRHWAAGIAYAAKGNAEAAETERRSMDAALDEFTKKTKQDKPEELLVARAELDGHIALARGNRKAGFKALERAGQHERKLVYSEPPYYPRPVYEALGRAAMKHGDLRLAERAFRNALEQYPGTHLSTAGLRALHERQGKSTAAGF